MTPSTLLHNQECKACVQVADFNLSRVMEASSVASSIAATNPRWVAPEVLAGSSHSPSSDVYAFGIILWEILTWQIPWDDLGPWQVCYAAFFAHAVHVA